MHSSIIIIIMYTYINTYLRNNGAIRAVNNITILCNNNNRIAPLSERTEKLKRELINTQPASNTRTKAAAWQAA